MWMIRSQVALQLRRPLRDKEIREELTDELVIGDYPVPVRPVDTNPLPQLPTVTQQALPTPQVKSSAQAEVAIASEEAETQPEALDPHDLELIVSYDVINEEVRLNNVLLVCGQTLNCMFPSSHSWRRSKASSPR